MSNSVFKEYPSDAYEHDDENLKIDSNLVILVNKNGSVTVDQRSLRNILGKKENPTLPQISTSISDVKNSSKQGHN
jgi:hypothetical protein